MKKIKYLIISLIVLVIVNSSAFAATPVFSIAWSEYPSWSIFGVAHNLGLINGEKGGRMGTIEKAWGVDIVLKERDYDPCVMLYAQYEADAVCITNIDVLNPSVRRNSVAIAATSTSYGGDATLVEKSIISSLADLKKNPTYGQELSVSQFMYYRNLEILGENPSDYPFIQKGADAAAMLMQQREKSNITVWNPMILSTLNKRPDVVVYFDSRAIPGEILDLIVVSEDSLKKEGGEKFALALLDTIYTINKRLENSTTRDETALAIGEKFSHLDLESMKTVLKQTRFYETPQMSLKLFKGETVFPGGKVETDGNLEVIMKRVLTFCLKYGFITEGEPTIGYGHKEGANFRFDPYYLEKYISKK